MARRKPVAKKRKPAGAKNLKRTTRDQYTVVLEDLRSHFLAFGENLSFVRDTLVEHTRRLDAIDVQLDRIVIELEIVKTELETVKEELAMIKHNQVTRDEFRLLQTRVARLERSRR